MNQLMKGLAAGLIAGLAASAVMNKYLEWLAGPAGKPGHGAQSVQPGQPDHGVGRQLALEGRTHPGEDATQRTVSALARLSGSEPLSAKARHEGGKVVHYAMGAGSAAAYGLLAEFFPVLTAGRGLLFGGLVWVIADEGLVPWLGLSRRPDQYPWRVHLASLTAHGVYGLTTEAARKRLRAE